MPPKTIKNKEKDVIVQFNDKEHFLSCLKENPGVIIIKFSATWCRPCKVLQPYAENKFIECPDNIICCELDVDENVDLYSFFKKNRQVNGVPSLLAFFKGNVSPFANESVSGLNYEAIDYFFAKCIDFGSRV